MKKRPYLLLVLILFLVSTSCDKILEPRPPQAPQSVITAWNLPSPPNGFQPSISKQITLPKYTSSLDIFADLGFYQGGEWLDIIIKSSGVPVYWRDQNPNAIKVEFKFGDSYWGMPTLSSLAEEGPKEVEEAGGTPLFGKYLYMPRGYQITEISSGTIYIVGYRLFIGGSSSCSLAFANFDPSRTADITYEVYRIASTPEWSNADGVPAVYKWLESVSGDKKLGAISKWMAQFK
ncbi:MAG: hypothetical protein AAC990_06120 [Dehalococcoides mccartyi]|uniref:hypothetical protein n=1 Tax=Dehalococcoides mccartyi TaxID=61435 RepID=UPI0030F50601